MLYFLPRYFSTRAKFQVEDILVSYNEKLQRNKYTRDGVSRPDQFYNDGNVFIHTPHPSLERNNEIVFME